GIDECGPPAAITAFISSNVTDNDIITALSSTATYLEYHRGITHTFVGVPLLALGFTAVMYIFSGNFWKTYLVALVAMSTHPLLDYTNTYGLRPFLPWNPTRYYGHLLP